LLLATVLAGGAPLALLLAAADAAPAAAGPAQARSEAASQAPASSPAPAAAKPAAAPDLAAIVSEIRSAVTQITTLRKSATQSGDKIKEACLYDRLRSLAQTLDSAQVAHVAHESAEQRGDMAQAQSEQARAEKALELAHKLRSDAENCVGNELR